jgi:sugar phosphate permease
MTTEQHGTQPHTSSIHYGWIIVVVGTLTIVACLGLARFAFGMLLPSMSEALLMSYDEMGLLGTANFCGYLVAVGLTPIVMRHTTPRILISSGLFLIAVCMVGISFSTSYLMVLVLYSIVGAGSGFANIPLMVLVSYWFRRERRGRAAGFIVVGSGFAIIFSGFIIPQLNRLYPTDGWRISWLVLAALVFLIAIIAALLIRNKPEDKGLAPVGSAQPISYDPAKAKGDFSVAQIIFRLGSLYFIFGATYVIYGTFIVTTMIEEYGFAENSAGNFWSAVGFFSLFSGVMFGILSDRVGRKGGLMAAFGVQTCAYLLAGSSLGNSALFASVVLYGISAFAIPAIMAAAIGDYLGQARAATGFAIVTFCFAIGQTIGPALAGIAAESSGSFSGSYMASAVLTATGVLLAFFLPHPSGHH